MSTATDMLALYIAAEMAVLKGQAYTISGRQLTRANLTEIRNGRREWQIKVDAEKAGAQGGSSLYRLAEF